MFRSLDIARDQNDTLTSDLEAQRTEGNAEIWGNLKYIFGQRYPLVVRGNN